ncbi:peptide methionine sulfoxide reductase B5-like [Salvia splendens]|uniref:peptide methionine sulfoxide reductase B5-like n=1 Tax=Salvia splendens TaxID=180675 RepID=UPI001C26F820|nr:peptide methionine sulfoxide reductase B5-like [Salvia splendens]XP_042005281.1 peptide methionine sulfoxide reductase B5-like [Salvia splendens]
MIMKISPLAASRTFSVSSPALNPNPINRFPNSPILQIIRYNTYFSGGLPWLNLNRGKKGFRSGVVAMAATDSVQKSEEEWRAILSPEQFRILRLKGTEFPGTGKYDKLFAEGIYECAGCGTPLYKSTTKFNSPCGWPAFYEGLPGAINRTPDPDGRRIEITCAACGGHLGHVFKGEGFRTPTDERHCVNSVSLKFTPGNSESSQ